MQSLKNKGTTKNTNKKKFTVVFVRHCLSPKMKKNENWFSSHRPGKPNRIRSDQIRNLKLRLHWNRKGHAFIKTKWKAWFQNLVPHLLCSYIHSYYYSLAGQGTAKESFLSTKFAGKGKCRYLLKIRIQDINKFKFYTCKNCFLTLL